MNSTSSADSSASNELPVIFVVNDSFLVFDGKSALGLRRNRIVGRLIGCPLKSPYQVATSGLPLHLSKYEAGIIFTHGFARFLSLSDLPSSSLETRRDTYTTYLSDFFKETQDEFTKTRISELNKRNIPITDKNLKPLEISKMKVIVTNRPDERFSPLITAELPKDALGKLMPNPVSDVRDIVFRDLYKRGFYITSGLKFGSDFLAYFGDPVSYHAHYAVRLVASTSDGSVDLCKEDFHEINALHRLCHTACKVSLLVTVNQDVNDEHVKYWTLKFREFLTPTSNIDCLVRHNPDIRIFFESESSTFSTSNKKIKR